MIRYMTAGESHGKALVGILEGMPHGVKIDEKLINRAKRLQKLILMDNNLDASKIILSSWLNCAAT